MHICCKWRRLVFSYQRLLQLRLFCTHGTPVKTTLDCWPRALPIVVAYGSPGLDPLHLTDEYEIMAALKRPDRVHSISLTITSSLLEKLYAIKRPFSKLEHLILRSGDDVQLTLPSAFQWGQHLRRLHSTRVIIPALVQLHDSSIMDLQLHGVPNPWNFSPNALPDALFKVAQLRSLSLHFLSTGDHFSVSLPSPNRVVLPALTRLKYRGITRDLEDLVDRIDAPRLKDIEVTFSNESITDFSKLTGFIDRIEMHKSHLQAHIISSENSFSISLIQPEAPTRIKVQSSCEPFSLRLSSMARIFIQLSALLFEVEDLHINVMRQSRQEKRSDNGRWLELLNLFGGVKWLHVVGNLSTDIVHSLRLLANAVLPALHVLYIPQPGPRHVVLKEAVVSFMASRRLSGNFIAVEYERLSHMSELSGAGMMCAHCSAVSPQLLANSFPVGPLSQQVMIEMLPDDILLNVFHLYLSVDPQLWPTLAWVCQRWRQTIFTSPLGLNLRLHCTYGTPVLKTLDCWPVLPIAVQYGGVPNLDPPAPEDDDNIIDALKHSGRVRSISLTVTSTLLAKISGISEPLLDLEELAILSHDNLQLTLPSTFRWGPRLRTLHSTRIAFPSFLQLLSPCQDLADLQLHEIPSVGYFSPEAFANALSGMTRLRSISLHLLSFPRRRSYVALPPPAGERIVLPTLTHLKYRGSSKYLDSFVARMDVPILEDIDITLFYQPTMDASQLGRFIERTELQTSLDQADVETSADAISISFTNSRASTTHLRLQISCKQLDWQLSCMAQICHQFSSFLFRVNDLGIFTAQSSSEYDEVGDEHWLEIVLPFGGVEEIHVAGGLPTSILRALYSADEGNATVLPALRNICVEDPGEMEDPLWNTLQSPPRFSNDPVELRILCNHCNISFTHLREFKAHHNLERSQRHAERMVSVNRQRSEAQVSARSVMIFSGWQ